MTIDQPETKLTYREGYYAESSELTTKPTPEQFKEALRPGAASELSVQFTSTIAKIQDSATVEYTVESKTVAFQEDASGQFLTDIDFAVVEYGTKGKLLDTALIRLNGKMTAEQRAHLSPKALSAKKTIALKAGATTLVLGVRDRVSGRFGTSFSFRLERRSYSIAAALDRQIQSDQVSIRKAVAEHRSLAL